MTFALDYRYKNCLLLSDGLIHLEACRHILRCSYFLVKTKGKICFLILACFFIQIFTIGFHCDCILGKQLLLRVAELVPRHPGRTKKQEPASTSSGPAKSGKHGKKKR